MHFRYNYETFLVSYNLHNKCIMRRYLHLPSGIDSINVVCVCIYANAVLHLNANNLCTHFGFKFNFKFICKNTKIVVNSDCFIVYNIVNNSTLLLIHALLNVNSVRAVRYKSSGNLI